MNAQNFPQMPRQMPQAPAGGGGFNNPNQPGNFDFSQAANQQTGFSEHQKTVRAVSRAKKNAGALKAAINTRAQLEQWLNQYGLKLVTSSVDLQLTKSFIASSSIVYPQGVRIPLELFLKQTAPAIQQLASQINQNMINIANHLDVVDPNQFNQIDDFSF
ncbi:MAG: hypothetical protein OHK0017_05080 [Patescibacteria group bacterium]